MICSATLATLLGTILWRWGWGWRVGVGCSILKSWLFAVPNQACFAGTHTQLAAWELLGTGWALRFVNLRSTSWIDMWAEVAAVTIWELIFLERDRKEILSLNIYLSEFLHHLSSLNTATGAFLQMHWERKNLLKSTPGHVLNSIVFFTWCHKQNDSNSAALAKLISGHLFTLSVSRNSMDISKG